MMPMGTLLLTRREIRALLTLDECIAAVEQAFRLHAGGNSLPPGVLGFHVPGGGFHIKAAGMKLDRLYFAAKTNGNFPENMRRSGMPTIQGTISLCDGENGYPLALMDSMEITTVRTGAATAVAAKYLARPNSTTATICGCGNQGRIQLEALASVCHLQQVYAYDAEEGRAERFATELSKALRIVIQASPDLAAAARRSDICVTCTPSRQFFLHAEDVPAGMFIAAVGADSPEKQELDPRLMVSSKVVVDILEQCATIGELHHALEKGLIARADVHAELAEVVAGQKPGRTASGETIVFDSTGTALQDVAAAALVYEKAVRAGLGVTLNFAS